MVGSFRDYFQKVKEAQELNKKVCGNCYNYEYDGYVFVNELGERMRPNYLTEYFPKYIAKHGMPKMRFHDLRHSCASLLLANGVPLKQIQEWLGHSDFSTTANIYAHLDYRSKISSAQAMEQGMLLPRSDDFGSRWENVTEQGKITEPDLNPRTLADQTISSLLCNCDGGVRLGVVSVSPVPAESRLKSGFFARKALWDGLF